MEGLHRLTQDPLPFFVTGPGQTDYLFSAAVIFLLVMIFGVGILYLRLHALPEHIAHRGNKIQLELVALLGLIALFTHNHLFWIAGLLLAFIEIPDLSSPFSSIARSLERIADSKSGPDNSAPNETATPPSAPSPGAATGHHHPGPKE